jgi:hypothetical protein
MRKSWEICLTTIVATIICCAYFPLLITHPNTAIITGEGDGLKNYYSACYYLLHNQGWHFTGMNYPYGEHISFADGQPGLVLPLKWLSYLFPTIKNYGIAAINWAMMIGLIIGTIFVQRILRHYRVNTLLSIIGASLVVFFSPQLLRMQYHYALSYAFVVPMVWHFILCYTNTQRKRYLLAFGFSVFALGLLHLYLALIIVLLALSYYIVQIVFKRHRLILYIGLPLAAILGMVALLVLLQITDPIKDRPAHPWGFFNAYATWETLFLPHPNDALGNPNRSLWGYGEGFAYPGVWAIVCLGLFLLKLVIKKGKFKLRRSWHQLQQNQYASFLFAALLLLAFSMCIPFRYGLEGLVPKIPFLQQFRALGRFAWVFYYAAAIGGIISLHRLYCLLRQKKLGKLALVIITLVVSFCAWETHYRLKTLGNYAAQAFNKYAATLDQFYTSSLSEKGFRPNQFQAIMALPYYHIGSEQFSVEDGAAQQGSMKASWQTGLPLVNVMLSRTSLAQTCNSIQLLSDSSIHKKIIAAMNQKPLLVLAFGNQFTNAEKQLLQKAQKLYDAEGIGFYQLVPSRLNSQQNANTQQLDSLAATTKSAYYIQKFFNYQTPWNGQLVVQTQKESIIAKESLAGFASNDTLELGLWVKIDNHLDALPVLEYQLLDSNQQLLKTEQIGFKAQQQILDGMVLLQQSIVLPQSNSTLTVKLINPCSYTNFLLKVQQAKLVFPLLQKGNYYQNHFFVKSIE